MLGPVFEPSIKVVSVAIDVVKLHSFNYQKFIIFNQSSWGMRLSMNCSFNAGSLLDQK